MFYKPPMGSLYKTIYIYIYILYKTVKQKKYSAFHDANRCKAALQKIEVSTLYLVRAYQWWLSQVDVAEMYGKNQAVS